MAWHLLVGCHLKHWLLRLLRQRPMLRQRMVLLASMRRQLFGLLLWVQLRVL